ncbi:MAG TPA: c-type cytochrome [Acidobacteriaceae bacterium]|nr:c-type cytochrome [Acidobacteriaceae bacterium]
MNYRAVGTCLTLALAAGLLLHASGIGQTGKVASEVQAPGDPVRGRAIFDGKGACLSCHQAGNQGSRLGSDLSDIARLRTLDQLRASLLDPDPQANPPYRSCRVVTRDGAVYTGKLLNQDQFSLQMMDSKEQLLAFQKSELREYKVLPTAPMPSYRGKLTPEEQTDVIAYLASLKGVTSE